jgi:hypothetical protein
VGTRGQGTAIRALVAERPILRVVDLVAAGASRSSLRDAVERGDIARLSYGVVGAPWTQDLARVDDAVACLVTGGVICGRTAAARHGLSDDAPEAIELLVPLAGAGKAPGAFPARLRRTSDPAALTLGVETETVGGVAVRMTGRARTVVDQYRFKVPEQHLLQALHTYLGEGGTGDALASLCLRLAPEAWRTMQRDISNVSLSGARSYSRENGDGDGPDADGDPDREGCGPGGP